jgi:hemoglobin
MQEAALAQEDIAPILSRFYGRVRRDPELGPIFDMIVEDWAEHLDRLEDFWSSLMLTSGRYKGNPVAMHVIHAQHIKPHMFARWLQLWEETTNDMLPIDVARDMQAKAARIGDRLNRAMHGPQSVIAARWPSDGPPPLEPYHRTAVFAQSTIPPVLLERYETKEGTWAVVRITEGRIALNSNEDASSQRVLDYWHPGVIAPGCPHHLEPSGPVRFHLEYFDRDPRLYLNLNQQGN